MRKNTQQVSCIQEEFIKCLRILGLYKKKSTIDWMAYKQQDLEGHLQIQDLLKACFLVRKELSSLLSSHGGREERFLCGMLFGH